MSPTLIIAGAEWRQWRRSRLVITVVALFAIILTSVSLLTALRMQAEAYERAHHQTESEQTFLSQPDRHPHRMIHYGHYIFRTPMPLSLFDPGLDAVTGKVMFLEGHRQNSATFSESAASADLGGMSALTPAMIYQILAPLLIILLGHSAIIREREARTLVPLLSQGVSGLTLFMGKFLALFLFVLLLLAPLTVSALISIANGASSLAAASLVMVYLLYLSVWACLTLLMSLTFEKRSTVVAALATLWLVLTLVLPAVAVDMASRALPVAGKIETELTMIAEVQELGDGHDVDDSVYSDVQSSLLAEQGVDRLEDLDVNIRGVLAQFAEKKLTETLNVYAKRRMEAESSQAKFLASQGWLSPALAVAVASRTVSGTDLEHYHRFLREAEELRFEFVSGLNQVHAEQLSYVDDINRNRDEESFNRTRMDAANWQLLDEFHFEPANSLVRLANASSSIAMLLSWLMFLFVLLFWISGRLKP